MAGQLVLKIVTDDQGTPTILGLDRAVKKGNKSMVSMGDAMKGVFAGKLVLDGINRIKMAIGASVNEAAQFELAMKRIEGLGGMADKLQLGKVNKEIRQMAVNTEFSASQIANAMLEVSKAGFNASDGLHMMPGILNLATAGMADLTWSTDNAIDVMNAFGYGASDMGYITDVMAMALNKSKLGLEDFLEGMKFAMPVAKALNVSFEETSAMMMVLADRGLRGSIAGNAIKNTMLNLLKVNPAVAEAFKGINTETSDLTYLLEVLKEKGVPVQTMLEQFDKRGLLAALTIGDNAEVTKRYTEELRGAGGSAAAMATIMRDAVIPQMQMAKNKFNEMIIKLYEISGPNLLEGIKKVGAYFEELGKKIEDNKEAIQKWLEDAGEMLMALGKFAGALMMKVIDNWEALAAIFLGLKLANLAVHLGTVVTHLTTMGGLQFVALTGLVTIFGELALNAERWSAAIDRANENVAKNWQTKEHLDAINHLLETRNDLEKSRKPKSHEEWKVMSALVNKERELVELYNARWNTSGNKAITSSRSLAVNRDAISSLMARKSLAGSDPVIFKTGLKISGGQKYGAHPKADTAEADAAAEKAAKAAEKAAARQRTNNIKTAYALAKIPHDMQIAQTKDEQTALKVKWDANDLAIKKHQVLVKELNQQVEDQKKVYEEALATELAWRDFVVAGVHSTVGVVEAIRDAALARDEARFEKRQKMIEQQYKSEIDAAQGSAFKQAIAQEKYDQRMSEIEAEREARTKEATKRQAIFAMVVANAQAAANAAGAAVGAMRDAYGGPAVRIAAGAVVLAEALALTATMINGVSTIRNARGGDIVRGNGNATSDNINYRLSPGERVFSVNDVNRMGGHDSIDRMLDRSTSYSTSRNVNVYIDNFIGNQEYAREMVPYIRKELVR